MQSEDLWFICSILVSVTAVFVLLFLACGSLVEKLSPFLNYCA